MATDDDSRELRGSDEMEPPLTSATRDGQGAGAYDVQVTPAAEAQGWVSTADLATSPDCIATDGEVLDATKVVASQLKPSHSPGRLAISVTLAFVVGLAALTGWLGYGAYQARQAEQERAHFVQVARQGALNLTTIGWEHAEADIERILESATGAFYDDFQTRSQPFLDVIKKAQSKSEGTITEAGLESQSGDSADVLIAVHVNTSNLGAEEQEPRHWRMRVSVQQVGDDIKVSNVAFVP